MIYPQSLASFCSKIMWCFALGLAATLAYTPAAHADCNEENLLTDASIAHSKGVAKTHKAIDGKFLPNGMPWNHPDAAIVKADGILVLRLKKKSTIRAIQFQGDHNDDYRIDTSVDGKHWQRLVLVPQLLPHGQQRRQIPLAKPISASFIRLSIAGGDRSYSIAEVQAYCRAPATWKKPAPLSWLRFRTVFFWTLVLAVGAVIWRQPKRSWHWLVLTCIAVGVAGRLFNLGIPEIMSWDELHFVGNARRYLHHQSDLNDHPPLGKLLMAVAMRLFGDNPTGWRVAPSFFGIMTVFFGYLIGCKLSPYPTSPSAQLSQAAGQDSTKLAHHTGLVVAALLAIDGFLLSYSRTALLDGILGSFALASVYFMTLRKLDTLLLSGALAGAATCIKWSGIALLLPFGIAACDQLITAYNNGLRDTKFVRRTVLLLTCMTVPFVSYAAITAVGYAIEGRSLDEFFLRHLALYQRHARETSMSHPATSHWYTWLVAYKPITLRDYPSGNLWVKMIPIGNPILWWSSVAAIAFFIGQQCLQTLHSLRVSGLKGVLQSSGTLPKQILQSPWILIIVYVAFLMPWIISSRDSYYYHYLPSHICAICFAGLLLSRLLLARLSWLSGALFLLLVTSLFFMPLWIEIPLYPDEMQLRMWLPRW